MTDRQRWALLWGIVALLTPITILWMYWDGPQLRAGVVVSSSLVVIGASIHGAVLWASGRRNRRSRVDRKTLADD